jgi:hypothetical protein
MNDESSLKAVVDILIQLVTVDGLVSPTLIGPPSRRLVTRVLLGSLAEALVGPASSLELVDGGVTGHGRDEGSHKSASLAHLGHRHGSYVGDLETTVL